MNKAAGLLLLSVTMLFGCTSAYQNATDVQKGLQGDRLTVGTVQREIRKGMIGGQVASVLGSPNIVSTDEEGREVWIYDKISTDHVYSTTSGGITALILGGASGVGGGGLAGLNSNTGAASTSQRTLTIIIKFDQKGKIRDFAYHSSRF